jgi:hypothetical protein
MAEGKPMTDCCWTHLQSTDKTLHSTDCALHENAQRPHERGAWDDLMGSIRGTMPHEKKDLIQLACKTGEEVGELQKAALILVGAPGTKYRGVRLGEARVNVLEESVDTMICALATTLRAMPEITDDMIIAMFRTKIAKWRRVLDAPEAG